MIADPAQASYALDLLNELADEDADVECSGPERFVETARGEGTVTGYEVLAMCTAHGEQIRGGLAVDGNQRCAHRRAHLLLVELEMRERKHRPGGCPDDGRCHHNCGTDTVCFRVACCGPLSAAQYPGDTWPEEVRQAEVERTRAR
jgi:hypothetical protein